MQGGFLLPAIGLLLTLRGLGLVAQTPPPAARGRYRVEVRSSADSSWQPSYLSLPTTLRKPAPLAVLL